MVAELVPKVLSHTIALIRPASQAVIVKQVLVKQFENDMLALTAFLLRWLLTGVKVGYVKLWVCSLPATSPKNGPMKSGMFFPLSNQSCEPFLDSLRCV
jgi:hypothetical protein